jgi:hypothetical protein
LIDTSTPGPVLTQTGQAQAQAVAGRLGVNNYDAIFASTMVRTQPAPETATWAFAQSVARARGAADRLLASGRHALDASDPVTDLWRDVHAGCRLAVGILDGFRQQSDRAPSR